MKFFAGASSFLISGFTLGANQATSQKAPWNKGHLRHIIPTASHNEFLIKASFDTPLSHPPVLKVGNLAFSGVQTDTSGRFWLFRASSLEASKKYELVLREAYELGAQPLCDPWLLETFPDPNNQPLSVRVLFYSCAGGDENSGFLPTEIRSRLLRRALSFGPHAAIANGDHVYRDLRPQRHRSFQLPYSSVSNRELPILGTDSEQFVKYTGDRQIADVYGVDFRSTPMFFIQDDHDYFDNDEATEELITFPPDSFMTEMARVTQRLYYPEFLPSSLRPDDLPDVKLTEDGNNVSESFGTFRYGRLLEALLYTVRRTLTMSGEDAVFLAPKVEQWILDRMADEEVDHVVNIPSNPPGWTAGKWGEWYPDHLDQNGKLSISPPKNFWQSGWLRQHDRLLVAMSAMKRRIPLVVSGDLHASALGRIIKTGKFNIAINPVVAMLCGTIGTGVVGWPSRSRGVPPMPSLHIDMEQMIVPIEKNGFTIAEFTNERVTLKMFIWDRRTQSPDEIDTLDPFKIATFSRPK